MEYADWLIEAGDRESYQRAEIERLEKKVEFHQQENLTLQILFDKVVKDRDTAWNDAIEAAAMAHEGSGCCHASRYAAAIRALKRSQPTHYDPDPEPQVGVTRLEVIDEAGRAYTRTGVSVTLSRQDEERTLKAFVRAAKHE